MPYLFVKVNDIGWICAFCDIVLIIHEAQIDLLCMIYFSLYMFVVFYLDAVSII